MQWLRQRQEENTTAEIMGCIINGLEQVKHGRGRVVNHSDSPLKKKKNPLYRSCLKYHTLAPLDVKILKKKKRKENSAAKAECSRWNIICGLAGAFSEPVGETFSSDLTRKGASLARQSSSGLQLKALDVFVYVGGLRKIPLS